MVSQPKPDTASHIANLSPALCGPESEVDDETESEAETSKSWTLWLKEESSTSTEAHAS